MVDFGKSYRMIKNRKVDKPILTTVVSWLVGFYSISTFVGYLMPNPFLNK